MRRRIRRSGTFDVVPVPEVGGKVLVGNVQGADSLSAVELVAAAIVDANGDTVLSEAHAIALYLRSATAFERILRAACRRALIDPARPARPV